MDKGEMVVALVGIIMSGAVMMTLISTVGRVFGRRRDERGGDAPGLAKIDDRLARMEQAIDAMSVEVERISEGQRFTAKLLAERTAPVDRLPR